MAPTPSPMMAPTPSPVMAPELSPTMAPELSPLSSVSVTPSLAPGPALAQEDESAAPGGRTGVAALVALAAAGLVVLF
uniref:Uncharacterized protein n=1 Tax=Arundo donax TaxID=35708 RepID=A0A0A9D987_ARUDO